MGISVITEGVSHCKGAGRICSSDENLVRRNTDGDPGIPLASTCYKNTAENRLAYIYDKGAADRAEQ